MKKIAVVKFWGKIQDKSQYKSIFALAKQCFPLLEHFTFEHGVAKTMINGRLTRCIKGLPKDIRKQVKRQPRQGASRPREIVLRGREGLEGIPTLDSTVTSKTAAVKLIGRYFQFANKVFAKEVYEFLYGEKDDKKNEVKKQLRRIDKMDILGVLIEPLAEA